MSTGWYMTGDNLNWDGGLPVRTLTGWGWDAGGSGKAPSQPAELDECADLAHLNATLDANFAI
jgi:hypothetical protein